jgi:hypothetical protein
MSVINGGKNVKLSQITKGGLIEMLEEVIGEELDKQKPRHKRGEERSEKDSADEEQDEEREKLADLVEEQRGSSKEVEMDDEDMSDESIDKIKSKQKDEGKKKPPKKK